MIYDYVNTKPPIDELYDDILEHGWLKDQAAKTHKYIERWKNAAGKWVYRYKNSYVGKKIRRIRKRAFNSLDEIGRDGTVVHKPGLTKKKKAAYERRTATRASGKAKGRYISSASGREGSRKIETHGYLPKNYISDAERKKQSKTRMKTIKKKKASDSIRKYTQKKRESLSRQPWVMR